MLRPRTLVGVVAGLLAGLVLAAPWVRPSGAQPPLSYFRLLDGTHNQVAAVDHTGALSVSIGGGTLAVSHVSSVIHVAAAGPLPVVQSPQGTPWPVTAHQGGAWTIAHITSVTHVMGSMQVQNQAGTIATFSGTALNTAAAAGQSGVWTIQALHQAIVSHVSSVTHVGGAVSLVNQAGTYATFTGTGLNVAIPSGVGQSGTWIIQGAHQAGTWNINHQSSVVHVAGLVGIRSHAGATGVFVGHANALWVNLASAAGTVAGFTGTSLDVNVTTATVATTQSGTWTVQPGNTANTTPWVVTAQQGGPWTVQAAHQGGTSWTVSQGPAGNALWPIAAHIQSGAAQQGAAGAQVWPVAAHQAGAWVLNVQHISASPHVTVVSQVVGIGKTITYVSVNQGAAGTTTLATAAAGVNHKILGAVLTMSVLGTLKFTDGVADLTGPMDVAATGGFVLPTSVIPYQQTGAVNRALNLVTTLGAARGVVIIVTEP